jgi:hypothetical protein
MFGKRWVGLMLVASLAGGGCMQYRSVGFQDALCSPLESPAPPPIRNQVYLFMMNGSDVLDSAGMLDLRDQLSHLGYPKVYLAQRPDSAWYTRELRRIPREEPGARMILLAYGSSATKVHALAAEAARDGLPVDAVIFLDPVGLNGRLAETLPFPSVVLRSHNWLGSRQLVATENLILPGVGHFSLPAHPGCVQLVHSLMTGAAGNVHLESKLSLPRLPLADVPNPTPRPVAPVPYTPDGWDFLKPNAGFPSLCPNPCWGGQK